MEKFCPKCNKENAPEALFCRNCASTLAVGQGGIYAPPQNQSPFANQQQNQPPPHNQPPFANQQWNSGAAGIPAGNYAQASAGPSGRAIGSLILTICGLVLCCGGFTAIPGAIMGWLEISAIREGRSSPKGLMMAQVGLWGGIAITVLMAIATVLMAPLLMLGSL